MLKIPYDSLTLKCALLEIEESDFEKIIKIAKEITDKLPEDTATLNKVVAKCNGISVKVLINSPNYSTLISNYKEANFRKVQMALVEQGYSEKAAWAVLASAMGLLV